MMDFDFSEFANGMTPGHSEQPGLRAMFYLEPTENERKSKEEGCPKFDDIEMIKILFVGDKSTEHVARVNDTHRKRWPDAYKAFKAGLDQVVSGTPLAQWPSMTRSRVAELHALQITTVEDLAGLSDAGLQRIGLGGRQLRDGALAWLQAAAGQKPMTALIDKNERLTAELDAAKAQLADLGARVAHMEAKRGEEMPEVAGSVASRGRQGR